MLEQFFRYFGQTVARPRAAFEALAAEKSIRWGLLAAFLPVLQIWGNMALHAAVGLDWLGTKPLLADPTFVAGFGYWRVNLADYVPVFAALLPLLSWLGLLVTAGTAHLLSKVWGGRGAFEQMINTLAFASTAPNIVIGAASEWLFGVPIDLLSGHGYWWVAAMRGEFGPVVGTIWNAYVFGVYLTLQYAWIIVLGAIAIRRLQRIPAWAAVLTMLVAFGLSFFLSSVFTR